MIYPIYIYGSQVLRNENEEIGRDFAGLKELVADMYDTMEAAEGVGLAAPQIGRNLRLFLVDLSRFDNGEPDAAGFKKVFVNPYIYEADGEEVLMNEGCLSIPGIHEDVWRPTRIRIRYMDEDFNEYDEEYTGYLARVIQHEYDHVEGKMFVDRLSPLRKTLLKGKLSAMSKGKHSADYKTRNGR